MITRQQAIWFKGNTLYHTTLRNVDGTPQRWKVNGEIKLWKTRPYDFSVPIKHGLRDFSYLTHVNAYEFYLSEAEAMAHNESSVYPWIPDRGI